MRLIVIVGAPQSGKTTLANLLLEKLKSEGKETSIVTEPPFDSTETELISRSKFKSAIFQELSPTKVVIADGLNYIKGFRYELFCFAREQRLSYIVAFLDVATSTKFGKMERPSEGNKWDKPLIVFHNSRDQTKIDEILKNLFHSKLVPKKATSHGVARLNEDIDQITNDFCAEYLKVQKNYPIGTEVTIHGIKVALKKNFTSGQLKRARREFCNRAKNISASESVAQAFADFQDFVK